MKDLLIVLLGVLGFIFGTFYLWEHYNHIARMFFAGMGAMSMLMLSCGIGLAVKSLVK